MACEVFQTSLRHVKSLVVAQGIFSCAMGTLGLSHLVSSSLQDQTQPPCIGSEEA